MVDAFASARGAPSLHEAAQGYARAGVPVFPCVPGGKRPLTARGFKDATTDLMQISSWWRDRPDANIGIPTGSPSGVDVIDIDIHDGATGFPAFEAARRAGLIGRWAWMVRTPSRGLHVYFPHAPGVEQRSWTTRANVDFRSDGGYVLCPPSRVLISPMRRAGYDLAVVAAHEAQPVDAAAIRAFLMPPKLTGPARSARVSGSGPEFLAAWVAARPVGTRNGGLFWAACEMARHGHDHAATLSVLGPAARRAGLGEREIERTVDSAFRSALPESSQGARGRPMAREGVSL